MSNRKLIRTTLAQVKERVERGELAVPSQSPQQPARREGGGGGSNQQRRRVPPEQTNAENFYYKKQMDARTPMVLVLQDGEELRGYIEWYDKGAIKLHREGVPNLLVLKHNIKYLYKENDEDEE